MTRRGTLAFRFVSGVVTLAVFVGSFSYLVSARTRLERSTMPTPRVATSSASAAPVGTNSEYGIAVRLTDRMGGASVSSPRFGERAERGILIQHWRRHPAPFQPARGDVGRMVQLVGLTHSFEGEPTPNASSNKPKQETKSKPRRSGFKGLTAQDQEDRRIKVFGLGEGTHDERECIVVAQPSTIRFKLQIPKAAHLRVAPAVLGNGDVLFNLGFRPHSGALRRDLGRMRVHGPSKRFRDWDLDLAALGISGLEGELELSTEAATQEPTIALWGSPVILAEKASQLPYNLLFIIVDAMRSDAISAAHDASQDHAKQNAKLPPWDAWFEPIPQVAPELDRLAARGTIWANSWSAAMWTRPSTVSLLTGMRASHTGLEILALELLGDQRRNFYASRPPLLPLLMRRQGASTAAIVNNMYVSGSVGVGIDFGFESVIDHRLKALDTTNITADAIRFLDEHRRERFFLLLNYASPHAPYIPPSRDVRAVRAATNAPRHSMVLNYLAEIHKDDAAIGEVLKRLEELELTGDTLVVVTADHGETMSAAHDMVAVDVAQGVPSGRFTHLSTMWEEAARVPIIMALPGKVPPKTRAVERAEAIDILPTILELEGISTPGGVEGRSLLAGIRGQSGERRAVVIEGRGARAILDEHYHLIVREKVARRLLRAGEEFERAVELYDLESDPGERRDIAPLEPDLVSRLRGKLDDLLSKRALHVSAEANRERLHFRFAAAGQARQLEIVLRVNPGSGAVTPVGIDGRAIQTQTDQIRISTVTVADRAVGFDLQLATPLSDLAWSVHLDGKPWPKEAIFAGTLGVRAEQFEHGLSAESDLSWLDSASLPHIVAAAELGMFVTRDPSSGAFEGEPSAEAQLEAQQAMQAWGYARKPAVKKVP